MSGPNHDDYGDYDDAEPDLRRNFSFPARYLLTDGWEGELKEKAKLSRIWWAERKLTEVRAAISEQEKRSVQLSAALEAALLEDLQAKGIE